MPVFDVDQLISKVRLFASRFVAHCVGIAVFLVVGFELLSWGSISVAVVYGGMDWGPAIAMVKSLPGLFELPLVALVAGLTALFVAHVPPVVLLLRFGVSPWVSAPFVSFLAFLVAVATGYIPMDPNMPASVFWSVVFFAGTCCGLSSLIWVWIAYGWPATLREADDDADLAEVF